MKHIQPFNIFEGLLKPRNIKSREQDFIKHVARKYPNNIPFTKESAHELIRFLSNGLKPYGIHFYNMESGLPFINSPFIPYRLNDYNIEVYAAFNTKHDDHDILISQNISHQYDCIFRKYDDPYDTPNGMPHTHSFTKTFDRPSDIINYIISI